MPSKKPQNHSTKQKCSEVAQILPLRLNANFFFLKMLFPFQMCLQVPCVPWGKFLCLVSGAEEAITATVASYKHSSNHLICPLQQQQKEVFCLKHWTEQDAHEITCSAQVWWAGGNVLQLSSVALTTTMTLLLTNLWISWGQTLLCSDMHHLLSLTSNLGCGMCCATMR